MLLLEKVRSQGSRLNERIQNEIKRYPKERKYSIVHASNKQLKSSVYFSLKSLSQSIWHGTIEFNVRSNQFEYQFVDAYVSKQIQGREMQIRQIKVLNVRQTGNID